jgi:acetyl esterase/lipase
MSLDGKTVFPPAKLLEQAKTISLPSRDPNRQIPCRLVYPASERGATGVMMHVHGGGWVLMSHLSSDVLLQEYANASDCAVISVGYRLAPEHPFPAAPEDCIDCAEFLIEHAVQEYGGPMKFIGGEVGAYDHSSMH